MALYWLIATVIHYLEQLIDFSRRLNTRSFAPKSIGRTFSQQQNSRAEKGL